MIRNTLIASIVFLITTFIYPITTVSSTAIKERCRASGCLSESSILVESKNIYDFVIHRSIAKKIHGISKASNVSSKPVPRTKKGDYDYAI